MDISSPFWNQPYLTDFYQENRTVLLLNTAIFIVVYPIEIILLSWLTGKLFFHIREKDLKSFFQWSSFFMVMILILGGFNYWISYHESILLPKLQSSVRKSLWGHWRLHYSSRERDKSKGEIMSKLMKYPIYMFVSYTNISNFMIPLFFIFMLFTLYMYYIHRSIGFLCLLFFCLWISIFVHSFMNTLPISSFRHAEENHLLNDFEDVLSNHDTIESYETLSFEIKRMEEKESQFQDVLFAELTEINSLKLCFTASYILFSLFIIYYGSWLVIRSYMSLEKLIMMVTSILLLIKMTTNLIRRVTESITEFAPFYDEGSSPSPSLSPSSPLYPSSFDHVLGKKKKKKDGDEAEDPSVQWNLSIRDFSFSFGNKSLFQHLSIEIPFRSSVLITGKIGSGKSTLFRILMGMETGIAPGHIFYGETDITVLDTSILRTHIQIMHQQIQLFRRPVLENLFYGMDPSSAQWKSCYAELQTLSCYSEIESFLYLSDAMLLSGGQKQIVLLLRAYFRAPRILLLDEPSANMDPSLKTFLADIFSLISRRCTLLCISHDMDLLPMFNTRYHLEGGMFHPR